MTFEALVFTKTVSEANLSGSESAWRTVWARKKSQRTEIAWALKLQARHHGAAPKPPAVVNLTRIGPRVLDGDNLQRALKAIRDEVALFLGVDDASPLVEWKYAQVQWKDSGLSGASHYAVQIKIEPREGQPE